MQASWTDNPLSYYPKASCRERFLFAFHVCVQSCLICTYPAECVLGFGCQPHSANPVWRLVIFSSCGVGLWYIKEHRGLAPSASLAVRFDSAALSLGDPARTVRSNPHLLRGLRAGAVWDRCHELLATQRGSSYGGLGEALYRLLSFCSQRAIFHPSLLLLISPFFKSERCVCFSASASPWRSHFLCASPSDSGTEVTLFKDGLGSEFKDPPGSLSTPTRRPFHSSLPAS